MNSQPELSEEQTEKLIIEAETAQKAIDRGLNRLGVDQDDAEIEILSEESSNPFESENGTARVKIAAEATDLLSKMETIIDETLSQMDLSGYTITSEIEGNFFNAQIQSDEGLRFIIGRQGRTLNSIQHVTQRILQKHSDRPLDVVIDAGDYRQQRYDDLQKKAREISSRARENNCEIQLDPMIPVERKIIHEIVREQDGVKSHSVGEDTNRRVVILPEGQS